MNVKVVAHEEKDKTKNNVVYRTETQYSTLFPYWNREFRLDFDGAEDLIVVDVWDWDAGKFFLFSISIAEPRISPLL